MLSLELEYLSREKEYLKIFYLFHFVDNKKKNKGISKHCRYFQS